MHHLNDLSNVTVLSNGFLLFNKEMVANICISTIKAYTRCVNVIILVHAAHYIHKTVSGYRYQRTIYCSKLKN